jgi:hypothetical protein
MASAKDRLTTDISGSMEDDRGTSPGGARIDGRAVISRADMAALGIGRSTLEGWYRDRAVTGHPEKAGRIGRADYWFTDEWLRWRDGYLQAKIFSLTDCDRSGAGSDLVTAAEAARMMGYRGRNVIHSNRRLGYFPDPDEYGPPVGGRRVPLWRRSTVWGFADARTGKAGGHKPGTPGAPAKPHPYAGDSRLGEVQALLRAGREPAAAELAATWNVTRRTAERIIKAARAATLASRLLSARAANLRPAARMWVNGLPLPTLARMLKSVVPVTQTRYP